MVTLSRSVISFIFILALAGAAAAQGVQTGVLAGFVRGSDGLSLPGATVSVVSTSIQGPRSTTTDVNGAYVIRGLPPGTYDVTFEFPEMKPVTALATVSLGGTAQLDAAISVVTRAETVMVTASLPSMLAKPAVGINFTSQEAERLPIGRTPSLVAEVAPGLTNNTPNSNQVSMSGAFAFDNLFLLDGVDINDNLFASPDNLFIEEAVEETQILTSGLSAEYGRFSGGVVNVVTRRGGNTLSGSLRTNFSNPAWTDETPFEKERNQERLDKMDSYYEGTLGGPVQRDKVWFFFAGRSQKTTADLTLAQTGAAFLQTDRNDRAEIKITATPFAAQTIQGQYTKRRQSGVRPSIPSTIDPNASDDVTQSGDLAVVNWNGVLSNKFVATAQYSRKTNHPRYGNRSLELEDSPFLTIGRLANPAGLQFNAPYFDRNDPEDRDSNQLAGSLSWFASDARWGTHDVKGGFERFVSTGRGGNSQSSTGFIFNTDYLSAGGSPVLDANGGLIPVWIPNTSTQAQTLPLRGATIDITTTSFYAQDRWTPMRRLTLDLGVRYERVGSDATGNIAGVDTDTWVPRVGATYDLEGNGRTTVSSSYAHYAGRYAQNYFNKNTLVGNAGRVTRTYVGPAGQGLDFTPAFDPANYTVTSGSFPTANIFFADDLSSAITKEFTLSAGRELGSDGIVRASYVWRHVGNFIETFIDRPTVEGRTVVADGGFTFGTFDNVYYRNSDAPTRDYQGLQFQGTFRLMPRWTVAGHYTVQLRNEGNYEGEAASNPGTGSTLGDYPEILVADRNFPEGRFDDFQRHKLRLWTIYSLELGRFGSLDVTPLWRYNSALTYSLVANGVPLSAIQRAANPGYARLPGSGTNGSQSLFFGERGREEFAAYGLVDLGLTYQIPLWRSAKPWFELEVLNLLNNDKLIAWDTSITADAASALDANGLPTGYLRGPNFGKATSTAQFPRPRAGLSGGRTFLAAAGIRF
jgi:outer membrane receptor protein involved in Fe transport